MKVNFFAVGFAGVALVIGLAVDYQQQSVKADLPLGRMSIAQYIDTYEARFLGQKAEMAAAQREKEREENWRTGGVQYLPEAPEGWTRRKYSEGMNAPIMFDTNVFYEELAKNGGAQSMAESIKAKKAAERMSDLDRTSWVYEKDDEAIFVSVNPKNGVNDRAFGSMLGLMMGGFDGISPRSVLGYDVIGGVGFVELPMTEGVVGLMMAEALGKNKTGFKRAHFRRLRGTVGFNQEVEIAVHANASRESTMQVLGNVDWDGMNAMLKTPMALVGNDVVLPDTVDKEMLAKQMYAMRAKYKDLRAHAARFRLNNTNDAALVMNVYSGGNFDVTGGAIPDLSTMIEAAFRKDFRDLVAGRPTTNEYQRIVGMMEERPVEERDQPVGEMSEELRQELMGKAGGTTQPSIAPGTWPGVVPTGGQGGGAMPAPQDRAAVESEMRRNAQALGLSGEELEFAVASSMKTWVMHQQNARILAERDEAKQAAKQAQTAPAGGGLGSWFKSMVGNGGTQEAKADPAPTGQKATIRRLGNEGQTKAGGCGGGQFCKTTN